MGKLAGVAHLKAIRALEKAGFRVIRQGQHVVLSNGKVRLTIPRANPIDAFTLGGIIRAAGRSVERFPPLALSAVVPHMCYIKDGRCTPATTF